MPEMLPALATFFTSTAGEAVAASTAAAVVGAGASKLLAPSMPKIGIPPPPGATMIDPAGQAGAADQRRRAAAAGGLQSTITGAGAQPASPASGPTAGGKSLLGS